MKVPIVISGMLLLVAGVFSFWVSGLDLQTYDYLSLLISIVATTGALISAVFLVYGYLINLSAFKESQKPRVLLQVHNGRAILKPVEQDVHMTEIFYANISAIECKGITLYAQLLNSEKCVDIPDLFSSSLNLPPNDQRTRSFPTKAYLEAHGVPQAVFNDLGRYKLRVGYKYFIMGEKVESFYEYAWDRDMEIWVIA